MLRDVFLFNHEENFQNLSDETVKNLIDFGADFQIAFEIFLNHEKFSLNKKFRDFIRTIFYLQRTEQSKKRDRELAEILECSRVTVARTRKRFSKWQEINSINLIEITEGEYVRDADGSLVKNKNGKTAFIYEPTGYKITFAKLLLEAVFEARQTTLYQKSPYRAIKHAINSKIDDIPTNNSWTRRKPRRFRPVKAEHATARKRFVTEAKKCLQFSEAQFELLMEDELEILHELLEQVFDDLIPEYDGKLSPNLAREMRERNE